MIKKFISLATLIVMVFAGFMACSSAPKEKEEKELVSTVIGMDGIPMPSWVTKNPKSEEIFYTAGYAKKSRRDISKTAAGQDARDQIARWVGTSVKNALVSYTSEGGEGENTQTLTHFENISKQVAEQTLVGVEEDELWVDAEGGVYMLCSFPKENVNKSFNETVGSFQRNEAAAFAEFKAEEALSFLEKETQDGVTR